MTCPSKWIPIGNPSHSVDTECLISDELDIPNIPVATTVLDDDDFVILRDDLMYSVTAEILAAYIVAENSTATELVFSDSPYTMLATDDFINVDATGGNVIINFLALASAPSKPIYIRKNAGGANTVTLTADGSELIDGSNTLVISGDGNAEMCVPFATSWRTF